MLKYALAKKKFTSCTKSDEIFLQILNKHAPLKRKILRQNYTSFISKPLRKVVVNSSYLENLYFKKKNRLLVKKLQMINLDSLSIYISDSLYQTKYIQAVNPIPHGIF